MEKEVVVNRKSCRICLVQNGTISINENLDGKLIVDYIQDFGNITVERFKSNPNSICNECNCLLKQAIKLKSNIINADQVIKAIFLQSEVVVKNEKVPLDLKKKKTGVLSNKKSKININKNIENFSKTKINKIKKITPLNSKNNNNNQSDLIINVQKDDTMKIKLNDTFVESFLNQKQSECIDNISNDDQLTLAIGDENINLLQNNDTSLQMEQNQLNHMNVLSVKQETQFDNFTNDIIDPMAFLQVNLKIINTFCVICNQSFQNKSELKIHNTTVHPELKKKMNKKLFVQCPICLESVSKRSFDTHEKKHQPSVLFQCKHCEKQFIKEINLKFHMNVHNDIKFQCELCENFYLTEQRLEIHFKRVHPTEETHFCEFCTKHYANKGSLRTHFLNSHVGEKKFECKRCQVDYVTKECLCDHQKKNHMDPKICNSCNKLFLKPYLLTKHMKTTPKCNIVQKKKVIVNTIKGKIQTQNVKDKEDATGGLEPIIDENAKNLINVNTRTQKQIILKEE